MSCLKGLRNSSLFATKYSAVDVAWIDNFSDFSIWEVEHNIHKLKQTTSNKTVDMMLLTLTMHHSDADVSVNIMDTRSNTFLMMF